VQRQVEREVERRNAGNRADRETAREPEAPLTIGHEIERDHFTADPLRLLCRGRQGEDAALHFDSRITDRFASLLCDEARELFLTAPQPVGQSQQDLSTLVALQTPRDFESLLGCRDRVLEVLLRRGVGYTDQFVVVRVPDLQPVGRGPPLTAAIERILACHDCSSHAARYNVRSDRRDT